MRGLLTGLHHTGWPFRAAASEWFDKHYVDHSRLLNSVLWWKYMHIKKKKKKVWMQYAGRHSPADNGCCCPSGPGSGPAVTSSLCLCYRWCRSSLGYPAFCWPGTSPLSPLPGKWEAAAYSTKEKQCCSFFCLSLIFLAASLEHHGIDLKYYLMFLKMVLKYSTSVSGIS